MKSLSKYLIAFSVLPLACFAADEVTKLEKEKLMTGSVVAHLKEITENVTNFDIDNFFQIKDTADALKTKMGKIIEERSSSAYDSMTNFNISLMSDLKRIGSDVSKIEKHVADRSHEIIEAMKKGRYYIEHMAGIRRSAYRSHIVQTKNTPVNTAAEKLILMSRADTLHGLLQGVIGHYRLVFAENNVDQIAQILERYGEYMYTEEKTVEQIIKEKTQPIKLIDFGRALFEFGNESSMVKVV